MKFLIEWHTKPKYREKLLKLLDEWKPPDEWKILFPPHSVVGGHRGMGVIEVDNVEIIQDGLRVFLDYADYVVTPITPLLPDRE
ncbi:MAG: DUF3303 domain-containing protein [Candidatus Thorarchaeota archaeon]|jgi:hypothetical protein